MRRTLVLVAFLALIVMACGSTDGLHGQELFGRSCAMCHSKDGSGGSGPDIGPGSNAALNLTDEQIQGVIRVGPGAMPGFPSLTQEQVDSLVAYIRLLADQG